MNKYFSVWNILFLIIAVFAVISGDNVLLFWLLGYTLVVFCVYYIKENDISDSNWDMIFWVFFIGFIIFGVIGGIIIAGGLFIITLYNFLNSR